MFREFVMDFGGQVLQETAVKRADYFFHRNNVIAELKTLEDDARREYAEKLQILINGWMRRGLLLVYGTVQISLPKINPICQGEWLKLLQAPVENIIRDANCQIRATKQEEGRESARGLLLIANDGNFLHTSPVDYMNIVARVLQKKTPEGTPRFPYIHGVVYFSYRVPSAAEGFPFWVAGTVQAPPDRDPEMSGFQAQLQRGWFEYIGKKTGVQVVERLIKLK
jgi:hypothetical protein